MTNACSPALIASFVCLARVSFEICKEIDPRTVKEFMAQPMPAFCESLPPFQLCKQWMWSQSSKSYRHVDELCESERFVADLEKDQACFDGICTCAEHGQWSALGSDIPNRKIRGEILDARMRKLRDEQRDAERADRSAEKHEALSRKQTRQARQAQRNQPIISE